MGILYNNGLMFDTNICSIIAVSNCHHMPEDIELLVFCRLGDAFRVCMKTIDLKVPSNIFFIYYIITVLIWIWLVYRFHFPKFKYMNELRSEHYFYHHNFTPHVKMISYHPHVTLFYISIISIGLQFSCVLF